MGYTHYWRRPATIPKPVFDRIARDFRIVAAHLAANGVQLAGPLGKGTPVISPEEISFNGVEACGHPDEDLGITWPAPEASGVKDAGARPRVSTSAAGAAQKASGTSGSWFAGALLSTRTCGGDCSHETFDVPRVLDPESWQRRDRDGLWGSFCKTAYKPYDLAVTTALLILKRHVPEVRVSSDGQDKDWLEARTLCQHLLGYGDTFAFIGDGLEDEATFDEATLRARQQWEAARTASEDTHRGCFGTYDGKSWSNDSFYPSPTALRGPREWDEEGLAEDILRGGIYDHLLDPGPPTPTITARRPDKA